MEIYEVLGNCLITDVSDIDKEERLRINQFFEENYGFKFKDVNSKAFTIRLKAAIMATYNPTDIIIEVARSVLRCKKYENWHEVVDYDLNG